MLNVFNTYLHNTSISTLTSIYKLHVYLLIFFLFPIEGSKINLDISQTKLRELIESSYPNPLTVDDINK